MGRLRRGQIIVINNEKYVVDNMIEFKEDTWVWQEYEIRKKIGNGADTLKYWLTVEPDENNKTEYYLYSVSANNVDVNKVEYEYYGKKYTLYESGVATVKSFFGPTDVDMYETCKYYDYISDDKEEIISVEKWSDGKECTIGKKIQDYQIQIKDEVDNEYLKVNKDASKKSTIITVIICLLCVVLPMLGALLSGLTVNKSINKYIEKNTSKYTYVTSVTNNSNNKKANVYVTKFASLDSAVKDIIDGVPEGITEVIDDDKTTETDGYALETKKEYAYIYKHTDGKIYIQVSEKGYVDESGTTYHSYYNTYYHRSYRRRYRSTSYYNYAKSARQDSINSRTSSGGGTSSGK